MKRRDFIALAGGGAAVSSLIRPLAASAQKPERVRRIAMLFGTNDPNIKAFQQRLGELGGPRAAIFTSNPDMPRRARKRSRLPKS